MTLFEKIYKLLYSPLATPYSVLPNYKLPNYEYVKFYTENGLSVAEMKCKTLDESSTIFFYYFNEQDELKKVVQEKGNKREVVFDRGHELVSEKKKYYESHSSEMSKIG